MKAETLCSVDGCAQFMDGDQMCQMHYQRWRVTGVTWLVCHRAGCTAPAVEGRHLCVEHAGPGMSWDQVMEYYDAARYAAKTWCTKCGDMDLLDDVTHDLLLYLYEKGNLTNVHGSEANYVAGILWKRAHSFLLQGSRGFHRKHIVDMGVDFDEWLTLIEQAGNRDGKVHTSHTMSYSGNDNDAYD